MTTDHDTHLTERRAATASAGGCFETDTAQVLQRLRAAFAGVIAGIPGQVSKPAELQRALKIDMKLSCKVFKVVSASGTLAAGPHVPGGAALRTFLKAARKAGTDEQLVSAATVAAADFDRLVASHAGDRAAFDSMVSPRVATEDAAQITLQQRRAAFRAQRHIFGVHAKVQLHCLIIQPASNPRMLDLAQACGFLSLRQLRPDAPLVISRVRTTNDDGTVRKVRREPLDPTPTQATGITLLREFCSKPLPRLRSVPIAPGIACEELASNGVGKQAAITCIEGYVVRAAVPRYREEGNRVGAKPAPIRLPCETLLLDLLVHEDTFGPLTPTAFTCAEHLGEVPSPVTCEEWQRLEPPEPVSYLGKGPSVLYSADVPRYSEMGQYVFDRLGWDAERFDVYRCRVEYPVLPSTVVMIFDLPVAPTT
jgi:hypothetical protein